MLSDAHNGNDGRCFPGIDRLAFECGLGRNTVMRSIKKLEDNGLISTRKKLGASTHYTFNMTLQADSNQSQRGTSEPVPESHQSQSGTSPTQSPDQSQRVTKPVPQWDPNHKEPEVTVNKHRTRFTRPDIDEVKSYCLERGNQVDPERFIDHYTANGWKVGKNSMKDWKAAVRTWEKNNASIRPGENSAGSGQRGAGNTNRTRDTTLTENLTDRSWAQRSGGQ